MAATGPAGVFAATTLSTFLNQALAQRLSVEGSAVETFDLVRRFGDFAAVDHINLRVERARG